MKPAKAAGEPTATPTILGGAIPEYTGQSQKIVTDLPAGMRYFITTEKIDPTTIDAGKIVPQGYTALDYLESTGTQYIDTQYFPNAQTGIKTKVNLCVGDNYNFVYGGATESGVEGFFSPFDGGNLLFTYGVDSYKIPFADSFLVPTIIEQYRNQLTLDASGQVYNNTFNEQNFVSSNSLYLFYINRVVDAQWEHTGPQIYYCLIYDNDVLVRNLVPARNATNILGMYDLANDKFYTNQGVGDDFIAGDPVNTAIKDWEWLDSVDAAENNRVLDANTTYYVYYYTPNTDTTTVTPLAVKEFTVACNTHVYGDWQTKQPATCTTDGERERVCQGCGHVDQEVVPATGHDFSVASFNKETGITTLVCAVCHTQSDITYVCTDREHGHEFIDSTIAPDCTEVGYTKHTCTRCEYSYKDNFVPALGHSYGAWVTTEPATTDHAGEQERICERCGAKQNRTLPALAGSTTNGGKDNSGPLLWGIIIGVIAVLAGCGGLAWLLIALFKPKHQKQEKVAAA